MATTRRNLIVNDAHRPVIHPWLKNHAQLDRRGGGDKTFSVKLALLSDPDDGSVVRAWLCCWKLPDAWWVTLRDKVLSQGWTVNDPMSTDFAQYPFTTWSLADVLADTTRKSHALKIVGSG